jgi:hypothetical protein
VDTCAVYITAVELNNPTIGFGWDKERPSPTLEAIVRFPYSVLRFQIVGLQAIDRTNCSSIGTTVPGEEDGCYRYSGALKSNIELKGFEVIGSFNVALGTVTQPNTGEEGKLFSFSRNKPFTTNLKNHYLQQPIIHDTSCNVCDLNSGPVNIEVVEFFYNIGLVRDGGRSVGEILFASVGEVLESEASSLVDTGLQNVEDALTTEAFMPTNLTSVRDPLITRSIRFDVSATRATNHNFLEDILPDWAQPYSIGARFGFDGQVVTDDVNSAVVPLGSDFVPQNGFSDWMFYDKIFDDKQPVQFAFALSANLINQYLASAHATGLFDEFDFAFDGSRFAGTDVTNGSAGNNFNLRLTTTAVPSVELLPYRKENSHNACFSFQGLGGCLDDDKVVTQEERPEQIAIKLPGLELTIEDVNNPGIPIERIKATADVTLHAYVRNGGLEPMPQFSTVFVTNVDTFDTVTAVQADYLNTQVAAALSTVLNTMGADTADLLSLGSVREVDARSIFRDLMGQLDFSACPGAPSRTTPNFLANTMPFRLGMSLKVLKVDAGGDYLTMAGNFHPEAVADCNNTDLQSGEVMAFCMQEQPLASYCP